MLVLQDPTNEQGPYLLESLTDVFRAANQIRGIFAFASSSGVRLIAEAEEFKEVARTGSIDLIVGTDAVTNLQAVDALTNVAHQFPRVRARAFLNPKPEGLFHPKFCFTKKQGGGHLIAGSGNLTESGLLGNWEAYSLDELNNQRIAEVQRTWDDWTGKHDRWLLALDDVRIHNRVALNTVMAREGDLPTLVASPTATGEEREPIDPTSSHGAVLIAEIPKWTYRPGQANFHLTDYRDFFGAREDAANRLVVFRQVNPDGTMGQYERERPPVAVKSRNFRFELAAANGPYSTDRRPIGVFVHVAGRTFFYRVLLPGDTEYSRVRHILERRTSANHRADRMRRARMTLEELRREWPTSPFWRMPAAP